MYSHPPKVSLTVATRDRVRRDWDSGFSLPLLSAMMVPGDPARRPWGHWFLVVQPTVAPRALVAGSHTKSPCCSLWRSLCVFQVVYKEAETSSQLALGPLPFPPSRPLSASDSKCKPAPGEHWVPWPWQPPRPAAAVCTFALPDSVAAMPVSLQTLKPVADRANPRIGVGMLAFSPDNYFLATRNGLCPLWCRVGMVGRVVGAVRPEPPSSQPPAPRLHLPSCDEQWSGLPGKAAVLLHSQSWADPTSPSLPDNVPNAVWVWDIQKLRLFVVLEHLAPVRAFQWDPQQPRLAICTGGCRVYLWSRAGCVSVQVPVEGEHLQAARVSPGSGGGWLWPPACLPNPSHPHLWPLS